MDVEAGSEGGNMGTEEEDGVAVDGETGLIEELAVADMDLDLKPDPPKAIISSNK